MPQRDDERTHFVPQLRIMKRDSAAQNQEPTRERHKMTPAELAKMVRSGRGKGEGDNRNAGDWGQATHCNRRPLSCVDSGAFEFGVLLFLQRALYLCRLLQKKEKERSYAEARARILGGASNEGQNGGASGVKIQKKQAKPSAGRGQAPNGATRQPRGPGEGGFRSSK